MKAYDQETRDAVDARVRLAAAADAVESRYGAGYSLHGGQDLVVALVYAGVLSAFVQVIADHLDAVSGDDDVHL